MREKPAPSRYQQVSEAAQQILGLGESDRYEFKRDVDAVTPKLLAGLANWVALDRTTEVAHLLVGVEEVEEVATGLVYGRPFGLSKGLDKAVARIQDMASKTRPIPVSLFIAEEGVSTSAPFLRIEIRPTMPPHFEDEGRRQTRQGRSTRALTDDELLRIYLDREAGSFATRFRQTTTELQAAVGAVSSHVEEIGEGIERKIAQPIQRLTATTLEAADIASIAASAADSATSSADTAVYEAQRVQQLIRGLREVVEQVQDTSPENLAYSVIQQRRAIWWSFTLDTYNHTSVRATRLADRLREKLSDDVSLDPARNSWELAVWRSILDKRSSRRGKRGTQTWWTSTVNEVAEYMASPTYSPPELPDLRAAIRSDIDRQIDDPDSITNRFRALLPPE